MLLRHAILALASASLLVSAVTGCAATAAVITASPVPAPKPTATVPASVGPQCFEDFGFTAAQEHHDGDVTWPKPLADDTIGVEPSCWVDDLKGSNDLFIAGWYGLTDAQYDTVNAPIEAALVAAGYELTDDTNGISGYVRDPGDGQAISVYQITRTDGYYEVTAAFKGRA